MKNIYSEMMKDEKKAPNDYRKLMKKVKTKREKDVIRSIINDEKKHYRYLSNLRKINKGGKTN